MQDKARHYSNIKYAMAIFGIAYNFILLFLFLYSGLSKGIAGFLSSNLAGIFVLPIYLAIVLLGYFLLDLPFNLYNTYVTEHKFSLSNQSVKSWFADQAKEVAIGYVMALSLCASFYLIFSHTGNNWWLAASLLWASFSVLMAVVMPVLIIPLFFRYKRLSDEALRGRIMGLAGKMKVNLLDCFEIDFSKKTLKGNAAFVGMGNTRRVILADTLKDRYSYEEIEVILAHEFAHYRQGHLLKLIAVNSLIIFFVFYLIYKTNIYTLGIFGFSSLSEIGALPVILFYFMLFGVIARPIEAFISRSFERSADALAIKTTGLRKEFVSTMNKLAEQNLADRNPNPAVKFFFFDHPPIDERIKYAETG